MCSVKTDISYGVLIELRGGETYDQTTIDALRKLQNGGPLADDLGEIGKWLRDRNHRLEARLAKADTTTR